MKHIKSRILKSGLVKWKDFEFVQSENFKELTKKAFQLIKNSIIANDFIESFKVWESKGVIYCIDGWHRCLVLQELEKEGYGVPQEFNADFIECKDIKHAAKLVPVYSSLYAKITDDGLYEFMHTFDIDFEELKLQTDIPSINFDKFELSYLKDEEEEKERKKKTCPHCGGEI